MDAIDSLERDISMFLNQMDDLSRQAKRDLLMDIFKKHLSLNFDDLLLNYFDLSTIISNA